MNMTLADRLALLPDYARAEDANLHIAIAERAVASGDAVEAARWAIVQFDLPPDVEEYLAGIARAEIAAVAV
jgi:hypothetical protein